MRLIISDIVFLGSYTAFLFLLVAVAVVLAVALLPVALVFCAFVFAGRIAHAIRKRKL